MFKKLKKKFTKTKEEVEEAQQQSAPTATASSGVASTSSTAMAPPPQPDPAAAATALGSSGSKLADRLKKISISSERIARGGPGKGGSRRLLAGPGVEPPPSSAPRPTPPPPAAFEASAWVDFGATPMQPQQPRSPHPPSQPSVVEAGVAERTVEPTMVAEEKYPPPQFLSPIEEARRKWEAAALLNPPSFRSEAEDLSNSGGRGPELSRMASDTSSIAAGLGASASSLDGWSAPQEPPDSPLLLRTPTRTISNTSANLRSQMDQRLYQIVHDFMADGEGELTVWAGDVVEVDADDQGEGGDGWLLAKVYNEDGTHEKGLVPASYCIEWHEEGGSARGVSPRNSLRSYEGYDFSRDFTAPQDPPEPEARIEVVEVANARFEGRDLASFGVSGEVSASPALLHATKGGRLDFAVVASKAAGEGGGGPLVGARFLVADAIVAAGGASVDRRPDLVGFGLLSIPSALAEEEKPLVRYEVPPSMCAVPLAMQVSWCDRGDATAPEVAACVHLVPSPALAGPLHDVFVTLNGLPEIRPQAAGEGVKVPPHNKFLIRSSHPCEVCPSRGEVRWSLGNISAPVSLKIIAGTKGKGEGASILARAHFSCAGSLTGLGVGRPEGGDLGHYSTRFCSGEYVCVPKYAMPETLPPVPLPAAGQVAE